MTRVKICGITNQEDAQAAVAAGADALGFVLASSPRQIGPDQARALVRELPPFIATVGVVVDLPLEEMAELRAFCGLNYLQLSGNESEAAVAALAPGVIKTVAVAKTPPSAQAYARAGLLLDTAMPGMKGGTGKTFDWSLAQEVARLRPVILAGGLNPDNVGQAIQVVRPYAVDVSSGVESHPGRKNHDKLRAFVRNAKQTQPA